MCGQDDFRVSFNVQTLKSPPSKDHSNQHARSSLHRRICAGGVWGCGGDSLTHLVSTLFREPPTDKTGSLFWNDPEHTCTSSFPSSDGTTHLLSKNNLSLFIIVSFCPWSPRWDCPLNRTQALCPVSLSGRSASTPGSLGTLGHVSQSVGHDSLVGHKLSAVGCVWH